MSLYGNCYHAGTWKACCQSSLEARAVQHEAILAWQSAGRLGCIVVRAADLDKCCSLKYCLWCLKSSLCLQNLMQYGYIEGHLKQPQQTGLYTTFEDCRKDRKVNHMAPKRTYNDKTASALAGLQDR